MPPENSAMGVALVQCLRFRPTTSNRHSGPTAFVAGDSGSSSPPEPFFQVAHSSIDGLSNFGYFSVDCESLPFSPFSPVGLAFLPHVVDLFHPFRPVDLPLLSRP
jgi:hypothetical protein